RLSTRATIGFSVFIKPSVVHLVPNIIADRLIATEPFIVLLALVGANVPFLNQRLFAEVNPVRWTGSHAGGVLRGAARNSRRDTCTISSL
ncbi:hypothetical protein P3T23_009805, partial [Paraburkholderia sp. GAS448]